MKEMVEKAKHYIHEGDIFQVVLSNPMRAKAEGSLFDTYRVLKFGVKEVCEKVFNDKLMLCIFHQLFI